MKCMNEDMMKAIIVYIQAIWPKSLPWMIIVSFAPFISWMIFVIIWTLNLNNYLLIPCLDSRRAYGSRQNLPQIWGTKVSYNAKKKVKHHHTTNKLYVFKKQERRKVCWCNKVKSKWKWKASEQANCIKKTIGISLGFVLS